jgi:hypothetical protein
MRKRIIHIQAILIVNILTFGYSSYAQFGGPGSLSYYRPDQINTITTAVPFLMIAPDSRAGGMGDVGVATSTDANSIHWNPSKLAFAEKQMAVGISYTPWLRALVPDINLAYLSGYYKTKNSGTIGASLLYFSLGDITFTDNNGSTIGQFRPNEFAVDVAYGVKLGDNFSAGGAVRYINSNLTGGVDVLNSPTHAGRSVAVDVSALYKKENVKLSDKKATVAAGLNISNVGVKMSYSDKKNADFIPINMRLGGSLTIVLDEYNSIALAADVNKLLVPTPPIYERDSLGKIKINADGEPLIALGKDPNRGVAEGIFGSFNDAPGGGKEELKEVNFSLGLEYWYNKLFAVRLGYFHENPTKGDRQYFTLGAGVKYNVFGLDFAYLIPTQQRNPLENTLRFSLTFDFDAFKAQNAAEKTE